MEQHAGRGVRRWVWSKDPRIHGTFKPIGRVLRGSVELAIIWAVKASKTEHLIAFHVVQHTFCWNLSVFRFQSNLLRAI